MAYAMNNLNSYQKWAQQIIIFGSKEDELY